MSPSHIVADGKCLGPKVERGRHLQEFDHHETDNSVLKQSTYYKDRVFINTKKERDLICQLLTSSGMNMDQFCELCDKSPNFKMVQNLVQRLK